MVRGQPALKHPLSNRTLSGLLQVASGMDAACDRCAVLPESCRISCGPCRWLRLMANQWELTPEGFDMLLAWLNTDREQAGKKYEHIRQSLIQIFIWRGCHEAEDLADTTINRVVRRLPQIIETYVGDPALYFFGVAKKVALECRKYEAKQAPLPVLSQSDDDHRERKEAEANLERRHKCMDRCLQELSDVNRDMITRYYQRERQSKVDSRKALAQQLGITALNLRVRAHRVRNLLFKCIRECLGLEQLETP